MIELMMMGGKNAGAFAPSYVAAGSEVIKLSPSLDEEWRTDLGYTIKEVKFGGGFVYSLHLDTSTYQVVLSKIDPQNGSVLGSYKPTFQAGNTNNTAFGLAISEQSGVAYMLWDRQTSRHVEVVNLNDLSYSTRYTPGSAFTSVVAGFSSCFIGIGSPRLESVGPLVANNTPNWSTNVTSSLPLIAHDPDNSVVYANSNRRFRSSDGAALSSTSISGAIRCVDQDFLYGATTGAIYKLNKSDLSQVWSLSLSGVNAFTPLSVEPSGFVRVITGTNPSVMSIISPDGEVVDSVTSFDISSVTWLNTAAIEPGEYNAGFWN